MKKLLQPLLTLLITACLLGIALTGQAVAATTAAVTTPPDKMVENTSTQLLKAIEANRDVYRKDPAKLRQAIDHILLPNFDTEYAARLVLAKHWRTATPQQRTEFVDAFYQNMLNHYGHYLIDFTADRMKVFPYQGGADDKTPTVRTEVRKDDGSKVQVVYVLHRTDAGWKAFDVIIEGISYVKSFRTDFGSEIEANGLDSVIQRLRTQEGIKPAAAKKNG